MKFAALGVEEARAKVAHAVDFCPGLRARSSPRGRRGCAYGVPAGGCVEGNIRVEREDLSANFLEEIKRPLRNWDLVGRDAKVTRDALDGVKHSAASGIG